MEVEKEITKQKELEIRQLELQLEIKKLELERSAQKELDLKIKQEETKKLELEIKKIELQEGYFLDQQEELKMERNPLYKFLMENTRYKENNIILMAEIKDEYNNWIGKKVYKLDNGTFPQVNKEYLIEKKNICKSCNKEANKNCCKESNNKNRSAKIIVRNLEFIN